MTRPIRQVPEGYSFNITLRCNSCQFLMAKGLRRDVMLAVLKRAQNDALEWLYFNNGAQPEHCSAAIFKR